MRARRFLVAQAGVTAVEFALLAPVFLLVTMMMLELGLYEIQSASLSYATQKAARQILTGKAANTTGLTTSKFINELLCPSLPPPMDCTKVVVNISVADSAAGATAWTSLMNDSFTGLKAVPKDNSMTNFAIGAAGSTVALQVYYKMPLYLLPVFSGSNQYYQWIVSTAAFRNEPFTTSAGG